LDELERRSRKGVEKKAFLDYLNKSEEKKKIKKDEEGKEEKKNKGILEHLRDHDKLLQHETCAFMVNKRWKEESASVYWFQLLFFVIFVLFYSIYIEIANKSEYSQELKSASKYISLSFAIVFELLELVQLIINFKEKRALNYLMSRQNWLELVDFTLIIAALTMSDGNVNSSFLALTIILSYFILFTKMDKIVAIGAHVTAFIRIIQESVKILVIVMILLLGFLLAFRSRATYRDYGADGNTYSFDLMSQFNGSFEYSLNNIFIMMSGAAKTEDMGINSMK
jgi:hypothetical protein